MKKMAMLLGLSICLFCSMFTSSPKTPTVDEKVADTKEVTPSKISSENNYIGYGYNMTNDKTISEPDALYLSSPILDLQNSKLKENTVQFNSSMTEYVSNSCNNAQEVAESYGTSLTGGVDAHIKMVKLDIGATFDTTNNFSQIQKEEYSYYSIYVRHDTVLLQLQTNELKDLLSARFQNDLYAVNSEATARKLFNTYGTHLVTGYIQGGIFEMTNYFASDLYDYVRENTVDFNGQVGAAIGSVDAGLNFSFNQQFAQKDNNSHAVNQYKCTTYGGYTFAGLTIDQAFKYTETAFGAGYIYQIWTDSINEGKSLVIVDIPDSTPLLPLWELLPSDSNYNSQRKYLTTAYATMCDEACTKYNRENPDIYPTDINDDNDDVETLPEIDSVGYDYSLPLDNGTNLNSHVTATINNKSPYYSVEKGSHVALTVSGTDLIGRQMHYSVNNPNYVTDFDEQSGSFTVAQNALTNATLKISIECDGIDLGDLNFTISDKNSGFSGGDGSANNPYLILNYSDFELLASSGSSNYWDSNKHYKLMADIDCQRKTLPCIGNSNKPFEGVFDGNFFTIHNYRVNASSTSGTSIGLFGTNNGTIKNLTVTEDYGTQSAFSFDGSASSFLYNTGAVAGANNGTIENVHVENIDISIKYDNKPSGVDLSTVELTMGGITGLNKGTIRDCSVNNSRFYLSAKSFQKVHCGGLIGINDAATTIDKCSASNNSVYSCCGDGKNSHLYGYSGGLIGLAKRGTIQNCLVHDIDAGADYNHKENTDGKAEPHRVETLVNAKLWDTFVFSFAGGLIGRMNKDVRLNCVVLYNVETVIADYTGQIHWDVQIRDGLLVGSFENDGMDDNGKRENLSNYLDGPVIMEAPSRSLYDYSHYNIPSGTTISNLKKVNGLTYYSLSSEFTNGSNKAWLNNGGKPDLNHRTISTNSSQFSLDLSEVKTEFFVGDAFVVGNLGITGSYSDGGDSFDINEYRIDSSNFRSDFVGTYTIRVFVYSVELDYQVTVINPNVIDINIKKEPNKTEYYVGEAFDPTGMEVEAVFENGKHQTLSSNEYKIVSPNKLKNGVNEITISYCGMELTYNVIAKKRTVSSLEIVRLPNQLVYSPGTTELDLTGLQVRANYEDGGSEIVDNEDLELIFPSITLGDNEIIVAYNGYKTTSFHVTGYEMSNEIAFINLVNALINEKDFNKKLDLVKQCQKAYKLLDLDMLQEDGREAVAKFEEEVEKINDLINGYNDEFLSLF